MRGALALLAVALVAALWLLLHEGAGPGDTPAGPTRTDRADAPAPRDSSAVDEPPARTRADGLAGSASGPDTGPPSATIRGRLVDATTGLAVHGGVVRVEPAIAAGLRQLDAATWPPPTGPRSTLSGSDGRFELGFPVDPACRYDVTAESDRHAPAGVRFARIAAGSETDVGDVSLSPATALAGRVVDADTGAPVGGIEIGVGHTFDPIFAAAGGPIGTQPTAVTAADGSFAIDAKLPPRAVNWFVATPGHARVHPARLRPGDAAVAVVRRLPNRIRGTVVGTDGVPVADVVLTVETEDGEEHEAATDAEGRFSLFAPADADAIRSLDVVDHDVLAPTTASWGEDDLRVLIPAPGTLVLCVTDAEGHAIERFAALLRPGLHGADRQPRVVGARHAGGECRIDGVPPGPRAVLILRPGETRGAVFPLEVPEGGLVRRPCPLTPPPQVAVRVVDGAGAPVAHARVAVALPDVHGGIRPGRFPSRPAPSFPHDEAFELQAGTTDPQGRVTLPVPQGFPDVLIFVSDGRRTSHRALQHLPRDPDGTARYEIAVGRAARVVVRGAERLRAQLGPDATLFVELRPYRSELRSAQAIVRDGEVRFDALEPGSYAARVGWRAPPQSVVWPFDLGTFDADAPDAAAVIDAGSIRLAGLRGTVTCTTPGLRAAWVRITSSPASTDQWCSVSAMVDDEGRFAAPGVVPGRVRFRVSFRGLDTPLWREPLGGPDELGPTDTTAALHVPDVDLRLTLRDPTGLPIALTPVLLMSENGGMMAGATDAAGRVAFRPAPAGRATVRAGPRFTVDIPAVDGVVERVLRAPGR